MDGIFFVYTKDGKRRECSGGKRRRQPQDNILIPGPYTDRPPGRQVRVRQGGKAGRGHLDREDDSGTHLIPCILCIDNLFVLVRSSRRSANETKITFSFSLSYLFPCSQCSNHSLFYILLKSRFVLLCRKGTGYVNPRSNLKRSHLFQRCFVFFLHDTFFQRPFQNTYATTSSLSPQQVLPISHYPIHVFTYHSFQVPLPNQHLTPTIPQAVSSNSTPKILFEKC